MQTLRSPGPAIVIWPVILTAAAALAVWTGISASLNTPLEDDMPWYWFMFGSMLTAWILGLGLSAAVTRRDRGLLAIGWAASVSTPFAFSAAVDGSRSALVGFVICAGIILMVAAVPGALLYTVAKYAGGWSGRWRYSVAVACLPALAALTTFGAPSVDEYKWTWPWTSVHPQLVAMQGAAVAAARERGIPARGMTPQQREELERSVPLAASFGMPLGFEIKARVVQFEDPQGVIWLAWGGAFGHVELRSLKVLRASD